jgi:hypothetical protein
MGLYASMRACMKGCAGRVFAGADLLSEQAPPACKQAHLAEPERQNTQAAGGARSNHSDGIAQHDNQNLYHLLHLSSQPPSLWPCSPLQLIHGRHLVLPLPTSLSLMCTLFVSGLLPVYPPSHPFSLPLSSLLPPTLPRIYSQPKERPAASMTPGKQAHRTLE